MAGALCGVEPAQCLTAHLSQRRGPQTKPQPPTLSGPWCCTDCFTDNDDVPACDTCGAPRVQIPSLCAAWCRVCAVTGAGVTKEGGVQPTLVQRTPCTCAHACCARAVLAGPLFFLFFFYGFWTPPPPPSPPPLPHATPARGTLCTVGSSAVGNRLTANCRRLAARTIMRFSAWEENKHHHIPLP